MDAPRVCLFNEWRVHRTRADSYVPSILILCLAGCSDQVRAPDQEQLALFEEAGSVRPGADMNCIRKAKLTTGPYRVVPGDVLEFTMPALLRAVTAAEVELAQTRSGEEPFVCRVSGRGTIVLPAIGELEVGGRSLADIEVLVADAYQQYVVLRPSIFAQILEYRTSKVYIVGAVQEPGVYALNSDQMTLVSLLTNAGGISEAGAAVVRIIRSDPGNGVAEAFPPVFAGWRGPSGGVSLDRAAVSLSRSAIDESHPATDRQREPVITLPVVGRNIPFGDIALEEGDTVVVEQTQMPLFSVVGLVSRPGNFDYPPAAEYNLTQAIAFAGGLDVIAEPRYATVYRMGPNGSVIRIAFKLVENSRFTDALSMPIQPGDVVAIEHTPRTRTNMALHNMLRFNTGVYVSGSDLWDRD